MFITANNNIRNVNGCVIPPSAPQLPVNGYVIFNKSIALVDCRKIFSTITIVCMYTIFKD